MGVQRRSSRALRALSRVAVIAVMLSPLVGCGFAYTANRKDLLATTKDHEFGQQPPADHEAIERAFIVDRMKDPESVRIEHGASARDTIPAGDMSPTAVPAWVCHVSVNAKNSYGGYVGARPWRFGWQNGELVAVAIENNGAGCGMWTFLRDAKESLVPRTQDPQGDSPGPR